MTSLIKWFADIRVSVPSTLLVGLLVVGWSADKVTVSYLDQFFVSEAQAQDLTQKVEEIDSKVDALGDKITRGRIDDLERLIFEARIQACMVGGALRTLYAAQLAELVGQWRALTHSSGDPPTLVRCEDLG